MPPHPSLSDEMTRGMDFAGGTVIHVHFLPLFLFIGVTALAVWSIKRKR